ncbi:MAG: hypothetical protein IKU54_00315 [Oscillospiraceae bacterium]|nr:hypothetical protein [Oscillospiraceae bacterium]
MWKFLLKATDAHKARPQQVDGFYTEQVGSKYYIYARMADGGKKTVARYNTREEARTAMNVIRTAGMTEITE